MLSELQIERIVEGTRWLVRWGVAALGVVWLWTRFT
jgi:hypothetical protein